MSNDLKIIKKKYGEEMSHFCRDTFPIILEYEKLLPSILLDTFNESHNLYQDLVSNNKLLDFKRLIYSSLESASILSLNDDLTPEQLMDKAGYILKECFTESDIQEYKKYYAKNEELCTFQGNRLDKCRVFFAVKKDVDLIQRENFSNPKRDDLYGTSVISIQFTKDGTNTLSIKNRYNHRVNNPDATFSNNLENIIPGLTNSFCKHKNIKQTITNETNFELPSYVQANDGKYYKYNREINNIYYCQDNIIIDNYNVLKYDKSRYLLIDYILIDLSLKKLIIYDPSLEESIQDIFNNITNINIINNNTSKTIFLHNINNEQMELSISNNNIKSIKLYNVFNIPNNFLKNSSFIESCHLYNTYKIESSFLRSDYMLNNLHAPTLEVVQDDFLALNGSLKEINLPNIKGIGNNFLKTNEILENISIPNIEIIKDSFLRDNKNLKKIHLPNIKYIGKYFLESNRYLKNKERECLNGTISNKKR